MQYLHQPIFILSNLYRENMEKYFNHIELNKKKYLNELVEFLSIPSISSDPGHKDEVASCAAWLAGHLNSIGMENIKIIPTNGHPIVYADWLHAGDGAKTLLVYGHYDVQPVDPLDLWNSPPFEPIIIKNKIIARGTSDDKGQLFTHLKSIDSILKLDGKLPVNIKFIVEGEEEAGFSHLDDFIIENQELLSCDAAIVSDTEWFAEGIPSICYGLRGICFIEVEVTGPNRDVHSGSFGGAIDNPINVLCGMMAKLKDEYGRITIPGFYDAVVPVSIEESIGYKELPFDEKRYCEDLEIGGVNGEYGYTTLERSWARPTLDLNGIYGGYTGEGAKTIIPSKATAKISMRLVPDQAPDDITTKITRYIESIAPPTVKIKVTPLGGGSPIIVPRDGNAIRAALLALKEGFGTEPVFMREGGSIPIVAIFENVLKVPTVLLGLGLPSDNVHSPNENFDLDNFYGGIKTSAAFMFRFSEI